MSQGRWKERRAGRRLRAALAAFSACSAALDALARVGHSTCDVLDSLADAFDHLAWVIREAVHTGGKDVGEQ